MFYEAPFRAFKTGEAVTAHRLVKLSAANTVSMADVTEVAIGVAETDADSGENVTVRLLNGGGTFHMEASAAITVNALLYGTADGTVDDADPGTGVKIGYALTAATAEGDIIEVLPL